MFEYITVKNILITIGISSCVYLTGFYCGYKFSSNADKSKQQEETIKQQTAKINTIIAQEKLNDKASTETIDLLKAQNEHYITNIQELKDDNSAQAKRINRYNRINGELVRIIQAGASGKQLSSIPASTSGAYAESTTYRPSEFAAGIVEYEYNCRFNTVILTKLQEWIKNTNALYH